MELEPQGWKGAHDCSLVCQLLCHVIALRFGHSINKSFYNKLATKCRLSNTFSQIQTSDNLSGPFTPKQAKPPCRIQTAPINLAHCFRNAQSYLFLPILIVHPKQNLRDMAISEQVCCQETCKYNTLTLAHCTEYAWITFTFPCPLLLVAQWAAVVLWIIFLGPRKLALLL